MPDQTGIAAAVSRMFHQHYFVEMPGVANAAPLSLQSFEARKALGSPYCIPVTLSHPEKLLRSDILGKDATFRMVPADGTPRRFSGCLQARGDELLASALKDVTITSIDGKLILTAAKEVWIGAGGSYIRINGERIENGTPGDILEKCAYWGKRDPQFQSLAANQAEHTAFNERFRVQLPNGEIARNRAFVITRADGAEIHGMTDANGMIALQQGLNVEGMSIRFPALNSKRSSV